MHDDILVCYKCGSDDVTTLALVNVNTGLLVETLYDRNEFYCNNCNDETEVINKFEYEHEYNENMSRIE